MTRMGKEFTLVLLGEGVLTAGAFAWPEDDAEEKANKAAQQQVGGNTNGRHHGMAFIYLGRFGGGGYGNSSVARPGMANVSKGGFGNFGRAASGLS